MATVGPLARVLASLFTDTRFLVVSSHSGRSPSCASPWPHPGVRDAIGCEGGLAWWRPGWSPRSQEPRHRARGGPRSEILRVPGPGRSRQKNLPLLTGVSPSADPAPTLQPEVCRRRPLWFLKSLLSTRFGPVLSKGQLPRPAITAPRPGWETLITGTQHTAGPWCRSHLGAGGWREWAWPSAPLPTPSDGPLAKPDSQDLLANTFPWGIWVALLVTDFG